jgi:hypothetical protein
VLACRRRRRLWVTRSYGHGTRRTDWAGGRGQPLRCSSSAVSASDRADTGESRSTGRAECARHPQTRSWRDPSVSRYRPASDRSAAAGRCRRGSLEVRRATNTTPRSSASTRMCRADNISQEQSADPADKLRSPLGRVGAGSRTLARQSPADDYRIRWVREGAARIGGGSPSQRLIHRRRLADRLGNL